MKTPKCWLCGISFFILLSIISIQAIEETDLLDPAQAFALQVTAQTTGTLLATWSIAEGYYLYRDRMRFESLTPGIHLDKLRFPEGMIKNDQFFGRTEIYRDEISIAIPIARTVDAPIRLELQTSFQGCADAGVCYPPQTQTIAIDLPVPSKLDLLGALTAANKPLAFSSDQARLLEADQAFRLSVTALNEQTLVANWDIAEGYYLYKDKLKLDLIDATEFNIVSVDMPSGTPKEDEFFGRQEVFYKQARVTTHLQRIHPKDRKVDVRISYQGCAEIGVCYPPVAKIIPVNLVSLDTATSSPGGFTPKPNTEPEQDRTARMLTEKRFWSLPAFFGFGLLLAFTPCVFPMIPILSSLIVGQGKTLSQRRAFLLSLVYVLAMAVTYTIAGVLAALLGQNIQALFQNPWILAVFSALFVGLALSMFGYYDLQLPDRWRGHLIELSNRQAGGNYLGVAIMGLLSALIVSPCVAPPLIGVMTVITATGSDAVLGGTALFALSLGMGAPLLVIGTSAGRLLPKVGHWMDRTKAVFGVLLLAVAIWLLERILPEEISMLLWATLLIVSATYMGALQPLAHGMPAWRTLIKGLGVVLLIYGILFLVGVASGSRDTLQPLRGVSLVFPGLATPTPSLFKTIKTVADMDRALTQANGRPVMLDFYADWCSACKELEKYTFNDPKVRTMLSKIVILRADVTASDTADQALLRHFGVIGPPAILFFGTDRSELRAYRIVGYMPPERFTDHIIPILPQ
jgi:thiol:disulfide interchange protein DsbD